MVGKVEGLSLALWVPGPAGRSYDVFARELGEELVPAHAGVVDAILRDFEVSDPVVGGGVVVRTSAGPVAWTSNMTLSFLREWPDVIGAAGQEVRVANQSFVRLHLSGDAVVIEELFAHRRICRFDYALYHAELGRIQDQYSDLRRSVLAAAKGNAPLVEALEFALPTL